MGSEKIRAKCYRCFGHVIMQKRFGEDGQNGSNSVVDFVHIRHCHGFVHDPQKSKLLTARVFLKKIKCVAEYLTVRFWQHSCYNKSYSSDKTRKKQWLASSKPEK